MRSNGASCARLIVFSLRVKSVPKQPNQVLWVSKSLLRISTDVQESLGSAIFCLIYMRKTLTKRLLAGSLLLLATPVIAQTPSSPKALIWSDPGDISSKNLLYGSGGEKDQPRPPVVFEKEDTKGSNPKFDVHDQDGTKWKVKLGVEAKPETVATRLLWAIGYFTEEDYLEPELKIDGVPKHLQRGRNLIKNGEARDARLKHHPKHAEKDDEWHWRKNPFSGTREFNGLRVMMSLINNWDVKDENNAIYEDKQSGQRFYVVTDLGASFGSIGYRLGPGRGKGNLGAYKGSKFITHVHKDYVDFSSPAHSTVIGILGIFSIPNFATRMRLRWIGRHIPREDAKWVGGLLAQLKPAQIEDAFRSAGYSDKDIAEYSVVVEKRIAELGKL